MFEIDPILATDSYKLGHMAQYPKGTEMVYSNFTPRSMKYFAAPEKFKTNEIVWFGLQSVLMEMVALWNKSFFNQNISDIEEKFMRRVAPFVGPSGFDFQKIRELHKYGRLPITIKSLPEGTRVPAGVPAMIIYNTDPKFYWVTNFLETYLSVELWKMSTAATTADLYYRIFDHYADKTGAPKEFIPWQSHDFSMRGLSCVQDAAKVGAAHLTSMMGTDNLPAVDFLEHFYDGKETFIGGSVPATEHSVMTMDGADGEVSLIRRLITEVYPAGIVSLVCDAWDYWKVLTEYTKVLKTDILNRTEDALGMSKVVFRPDSGDPVKIICGDLSANTEWERKGSVEVLWDVFGGTVNDKGYKMLNPKVGLIYGDSITPQRANDILSILAEKGFASSNVVLGIGSYTYQYVTRDTCGFAIKSTYGIVNGIGRDIFKNPKTDDGTKKSAKGLLSVEMINGQLKLFDQQKDIHNTGLLELRMYDGSLVGLESITDIRTRIAESR